MLQWAGQFKGADDKKSHSWVEDNNIVSLFEAGKQKVSKADAGRAGDKRGQRHGCLLASLFLPDAALSPSPTTWQDWERRWKGKTVLLKNPYNGETLEAQVAGWVVMGG